MAERRASSLLAGQASCAPQSTRSAFRIQVLCVKSERDGSTRRSSPRCFATTVTADSSLYRFRRHACDRSLVAVVTHVDAVAASRLAHTVRALSLVPGLIPALNLLLPIAFSVNAAQRYSQQWLIPALANAAHCGLACPSIDDRTQHRFTSMTDKPRHWSAIARETELSFYEDSCRCWRIKTNCRND